MGAERHARQMATCRTFLQRVEDDDYPGILKAFDRGYTRDSVLLLARQRRDDLTEACRILRRHMLSWWD